MQAMYGNIKRVMKTASVFFSRPVAISKIRAGLKMMPAMLTSTVAQTRVVATWSTRILVLSSPSWVLYSDKIGTKAWAKAPSANRRRSKFGMRKATMRASDQLEAPKARANRLSRSRPVTRDSMVMLEMAARVLSKFMAQDYSPATLWPAASVSADYIFGLPSAQLLAIIEGCTEFCYADTFV